MIRSCSFNDFLWKKALYCPKRNVSKMSSNQFVHVMIENDSFDSNDKENVKVHHQRSLDDSSTSRRKRITKNVNKIWKKTTKKKKNKALKNKNHHDDLSNRKSKQKNEKKEIALMASSSLLAPSLSNDSSKSLVPFPTCSIKEYYRPPLSLNKPASNRDKIKLRNSPKKRKTPTNDSNHAGGNFGAKADGELCSEEKVSPPKKLKTTTKVLTKNLSEEEGRDFFPSCDDKRPEDNDHPQYTYLHDDMTSSHGDSDIFVGCEKELKNSGHYKKQTSTSPIAKDEKSKKFTSSDPILHPPPPPPPPPPISTISSPNSSKKKKSKEKNKGVSKPKSPAKHSAPLPTIVVKKKGNASTGLEPSSIQAKSSRTLKLYRKKKIEDKIMRSYHARGSLRSDQLEILRIQSSSILDNDVSDEDDVSTLSCSKIEADIDNSSLVDILLDNEETQFQVDENKSEKNMNQNIKANLSPTESCSVSSSSLHEPEITIGRVDDHKDDVKNHKKGMKKARKKEDDTYSSASFDSYSTYQSYQRNKRKKRNEHFPFFNQEYVNEVKNIAKQEWENGITSAVNIVSKIKSRMADCIAPGVDMIHASPGNKKPLKYNDTFVPLCNKYSPPMKFVVCDDASVDSYSADRKSRSRKK